jgi:hypothetical protein
MNELHHTLGRKESFGTLTVNLDKFDHINRLIILPMIPLSIDR